MYIIFYLIQLSLAKIVLTLKKKFKKYQRKEEKYSHKSYPRDAVDFRSFYFSK